MQVTQIWDIALLGIPGLFIGLMIGYIIGGQSSFRMIDRFCLGLIISGISGLILSLIISIFIPVQSLEIVFIVLAFAGGYYLGLFLNWAPLIDPKPKNHIIYEPDDDDAFDREIEEVLNGQK